MEYDAAVQIRFKRDPAWQKVGRKLDISFLVPKRKAYGPGDPSFVLPNPQVVGQARVADYAWEKLDAAAVFRPQRNTGPDIVYESFVSFPFDPLVNPPHPVIKCRVTGCFRRRSPLDDETEQRLDAKDEERWDTWREKSKRERSPIEDY